MKLRTDYGRHDPPDAGLSEKEVLRFSFSDIHRSRPQRDCLTITLLCAQGLLNRARPSAFADHTVWCADDGTARCDGVFAAYYADKKGYAFGEVLSGPDFLRRVAPAFSGVFVYADDPMSMIVALNLAVYNAALPVSRSDYEELRGILAALPVLDEIDVGALSRREVYDFLLAEVLPHTDRTSAHSIGFFCSYADGVETIRYYDMGLDDAVRNGNFIFLVPCNERPRGSYDFMVSGSEEDYAVFCDIMRALDAPAALTGWNEPEWRWALTATRGGHFVYCTDWSPNLSFHAAVPVQTADLRLNAHCPPPRKGPPANKVYISVVANEGDTPKMVSQLYNTGWLSARRGDYPANWAINPVHVSRYPALMEYYVTTATPNDSFVMGPDGAGYTVMRENPRHREFLRATRAYNARAGLTGAEVWFADPKGLREMFEEMPELTGASIEPHPALPRGEVFSVAGRPVIRYAEKLYYWPAKPDFCTGRRLNREALRQELESYYDPARPVFLPMYGYESWVVDEFAAFADTLDPQRFELVSNETLYALAAQVARPLSRTYTYPAEKVVWDDSVLFDASAWEPMSPGCEVRVTKEGLRLKIGAGAAAAKTGFRNDMISATAAPGQYSALVGVRGVRLPADAYEVRVRAAEMSEGCDWMFWMFGDYDGFGLTDRWEPFWKPSWPGERSEEIPLRVQRYAHPSDRLVLCVEGKIGDEVLFDKLVFAPKKR